MFKLDQEQFRKKLNYKLYPEEEIEIDFGEFIDSDDTQELID